MEMTAFNQQILFYYGVIYNKPFTYLKHFILEYTILKSSVYNNCFFDVKTEIRSTSFLCNTSL